MKSRLLLILALAFAPIAVTFTGCTATQQSTTYKTLDVVGTAAKNSMDAATQLLKAGAITVAQWQNIANNYDNYFQPAYNLAVQAAGSTSAAAPASLVTQQQNISTQVAALTPTTK